MDRVAAVFDLDGTLVAFKFDVEGTRNSIIKELSAKGFDTSALSLTTPTQMMIDAARAQIESGNVKADFAEVRSRLYSILDESEMSTCADASVFPGTRRTLDYLKSKQVRMGVLTNSGKKATGRILANAGLEDCFEFVLCRDDVSDLKPRPEGLTRVISLLGMRPDRIFYIGDSRYDILAARKAGVKFVAVPSGNYSEAKLREYGADYVIPSISELPGLLGV